jgi:Flp pilus assembly protein TadG
MNDSPRFGPPSATAVPPADARRPRRGGRQRPGYSLVELAFATPFLLLLMLGTIDLGRMFFDFIQLRGAVIEGATYGGRNPSDSGGIAAQVTNHGVPSGTAITIVTQAGCFTKGGTGDISVTASNTFSPITTGFLQAYWHIGAVNLSARSTMRCLT